MRAVYVIIDGNTKELLAGGFNTYTEALEFQRRNYRGRYTYIMKGLMKG